MGRIATTVMVFIAFAWIPVIKNAQGLYGYLQAVQGYLAPPIFVVFFLGVFLKRMNAYGALWSMIVGFLLGIFRMLVDTPVTLGLPGFEKGYAPGSLLWIINNIYFQYFSVLITLVSAAVMIGVSYATSEPDYGQIKNLTLGTTTEADKASTRASWTWREVSASLLVLVCILASYLYSEASSYSVFPKATGSSHESVALRDFSALHQPVEPAPCGRSFGAVAVVLEEISQRLRGIVVPANRRE
jgi:SSS family solute:Na+ symporter